MSTRFNPGDIVSWTSTMTGKHIGKLVEYDYKGNPVVHFGQQSSFFKCYGKALYTFGPEESLLLEGPPMSKEERVLNRCKKLWNNSKYAKQFGVQY